MAVFIRKNIVTFSFVFAATDPTLGLTQPGAASVVLTYKDTGGSSHTDIISLSFSTATNAWSGTWDTSKSGHGTVYWMGYGFGTLQASDQGEFQVEANPANTI